MMSSGGLRQKQRRVLVMALHNRRQREIAAQFIASANDDWPDLTFGEIKVELYQLPAIRKQSYQFPNTEYLPTEYWFNKTATQPLYDRVHKHVYEIVSGLRHRGLCETMW
jgi:hypothetical protein